MHRILCRLHHFIQKLFSLQGLHEIFVVYSVSFLSHHQYDYTYNTGISILIYSCSGIHNSGTLKSRAAYWSDIVSGIFFQTLSTISAEEFFISLHLSIEINLDLSNALLTFNIKFKWSVLFLDMKYMKQLNA